MKPSISQLSKHVSRLRQDNRKLKSALKRIDKASESQHFGGTWGNYSREDSFVPVKSEDYLQLYESYFHVFACVDAIARNLAKLPFRIYRLKSLSGTKDRRGEEITDGPFWNLFNQPNQFTSGYNLFYGMIAFLKLVGITYCEKVGSDPANPSQLWSLRPDWMRILPDAKNLIAGYEYTVDGKRINYKPEEILRIKTWHPRSEFYGLSTVSPAKDSIITDLYASKYSKQFFKQGGHLDWYITSKEEVGEEAYKRLKAEAKTRFGGLDRAFEPAVLDSGLEIKELGGTPDRNVLRPQRDLSREGVCEVYGVPVLMLALPNETHYNNADIQYVFFWEQTAQPVGREIEDTINRDILWPLDMEGAFDYSQVQCLQPKISELANTTKTLIDAKAMTPNEARAKILIKAFPDIQPLEGGDTFPQPQLQGFGFQPPVAKSFDLGLILKIIEMTKGGEGSGHHEHYPAPEGRGSSPSIKPEDIASIEKDIVSGQFIEAFDKLRKHGLSVEEVTRIIHSARRNSNLKPHLDREGIRCRKGRVDLVKALTSHRNKMVEYVYKGIEKVIGEGYSDYGKAVNAVVGLNLKKLAFVKKDMVAEAILSMDPVTKAMAKKLLQVEKSKIRDIVQAEYQRAKGTEPDEATLGQLDAKLSTQLDKIVDKSMGQVEETAKNRVSQHLTDMLNSDASVESIQKDISSLLGNSEEYAGQARTIARTESLKFVETSRFQSLADMGFSEKEWFHSGHDKPREGHLALDGAVVPMNEPFVNEDTGNELLYPGDPNAGAEEDANCGCTFAEHVAAAVDEGGD